MNEQKPMRVERSQDGTLKIADIFDTIQGEGPYAGWPAVFVRLMGCNLQCPWCDTDYSTTRYVCSPEEVYHLTTKIGPRKLVVITGGEPFRQNITPLVIELLRHGLRVQVETNGTLWPGDDFPWDDVTVVCSPKTPSIHPKTAKRVHAYKYVLSHDSVSTLGYPMESLGFAHKELHVALPPLCYQKKIYLQPMDAKDPIENQKNIDAVVDVVMSYRSFIMGVQLHKIAKLP